MPRWPNENAFDRIIVSAAAHYGVPVWLIKATIAKESSFNPAADTGSIGLMQIEEPTARDRGFKGTRAELFDPAVNIEIGTRHLKWLMGRFPGVTPDALYAAFNSGAPRKNAAGQFVNSKGSTIVEDHVAGWRRAADYFNPAWRSGRGAPLA